jgi:hypothetical protein
VILEVVCDGIFLVVGDWVNVAEAATGREGAAVGVTLGIDYGGLRFMDGVAGIDFGCADVGDVGTGVGPSGVEDCGVWAKTPICAVTTLVASYSVVAGRVEN